jgi:hypothetical protein
MVRVPGYRTEMYCASCEVRTEFIYVMQKKVDRHCGIVVRVPDYRTGMYCASCEVRTEFKCYVEESRPPLWSRDPGVRVRFLSLLDFLKAVDKRRSLVHS